MKEMPPGSQQMAMELMSALAPVVRRHANKQPADVIAAGICAVMLGSVALLPDAATILAEMESGVAQFRRRHFTQ